MSGARAWMRRAWPPLRGRRGRERGRSPSVGTTAAAAEHPCPTQPSAHTFPYRRHEEARQVLLSLRGDYPAFVEWELQGMISATTESASGWAKLREPAAMRTVLVGIAISVIQQIVGVNSVNGYAPQILVSAGFSGKSSLTLSIVIGVVKVGFVAVALGLMDCLGRKTLLIGGTVVMGASMIVLGVLLDKYSSDPPTSVAWGSASMLFLAMASFELGQGPVVWLLMSEIFPLNIRGAAMSLGSASNFLFNFIVMLTFPLLKSPHALGEGGVFYLYSGICFASCVFIGVFVPETRGRTLEDIEQVFRRGTDRKPASSAAVGLALNQ